MSPYIEEVEQHREINGIHVSVKKDGLKIPLTKPEHFDNLNTLTEEHDRELKQALDRIEKCLEKEGND